MVAGMGRGMDSIEIGIGHNFWERGSEGVQSRLFPVSDLDE